MGAPQDDSVEDASLARRVVGGDAEAEELLCRRLLPRVRAYGKRHLRDDVAAADLAQHVVVVVLEALREGRVGDVDRLGAFVMGACRNTVLDWKKIEHRRGALLARFGPSFALAIEPEAELVDRARLAQCMEKLAPRARTILALTYFAEREPAEVAREVAMTLGNVRVARHRALAQLHDCITRGGER